MKRRYVEKTAKTVQDAIALALVELDLELEEVKIEVLDEGKTAIFGLLGGKMARVRVSAIADTDSDGYDDNREEETERTDNAQDYAGDSDYSGVEKRYKSGGECEDAAGGGNNGYEDIEEGDEKGVDRNDVFIHRQCRATEEDMAKVQEFLKQLFDGIHVDIEMVVEQSDEGCTVSIASDDSGILIGHRGETLESIQYLTNLCINRGRSEFIRVTVDIENYRKKRVEALIRLADKVSEKVIRIRRNVTLEPMNSFERRIIHSALQNNPKVETYSVGEDPNRKVVVTQKNKGGQAYNRHTGYRR